MATGAQQPIQKPDIVQGFIDKFNKAAASDATLQRHTQASLDWFRRRISKDLNRNRLSMIHNSGDFKRRTGRENRTLIGRLYYFQYEAVEAGDAELQVYDQFPMIFVFNTSLSKDGKKLIHALNMHYLTPKERAFVYLKLMKIKNRKGWTDTTKLKISWELIKQLMSSHLYEKAVHTYRVDRLQSRMIEIVPEDWEIAVFLQLAHWKHVKGDAVSQKGIRRAQRSK